MYITKSINVSDAESNQIASAEVWFSSDFSSMDSLESESDHSEIDFSYSSLTGILTIDGESSTDDFGDILNDIIFSRSDKDSFAMTSSLQTFFRTVSFQVTDSTGAVSNTASRNLKISRG